MKDIAGFSFKASFKSENIGNFLLIVLKGTFLSLYNIMFSYPNFRILFKCLS